MIVPSQKTLAIFLVLFALYAVLPVFPAEPLFPSCPRGVGGSCTPRFIALFEHERAGDALRSDPFSIISGGMDAAGVRSLANAVARNVIIAGEVFPVYWLAWKLSTKS